MRIVLCRILAAWLLAMLYANAEPRPVDDRLGRRPWVLILTLVFYVLLGALGVVFQSGGIR